MRTEAFPLGVTMMLVALNLGCGDGSPADWDRRVSERTEVIVEGGASRFQGVLAFRSPEALAAQEVPFASGSAPEEAYRGAWLHYSNQWTLRLAIGPKPGAKPDPIQPLALDVENNGGMWGDHSRNLQRLMFEMGEFIRLRTSSGEEIQPAAVEFQRAFGIGLDRNFMLVFPNKHQGKDIVPPFTIIVKEFGQGTGTMQFEMSHAPARLSWWRAKRIWAQGLNL